MGQIPPSNQIVVLPGESIQAAVDRAVTGDTVVVESGTYTQTVRIAKNGISLIAGSQPVVLRAPKRFPDGITVGSPSECSAGRVQGIQVAGFTVSGFADAGIAVICADHWELTGNHASNDGWYGVYTSYCTNGQLHGNFASGATRAGIHIGLSQDIEAVHNTARQNVIGFEVRETIRSTLDSNKADSNTAGIFEMIMPGDALERNRDNLLSDNLVERNNRPNKCSPPTDPVCKVPPGVGIAVVGGSHNLNLRNRVIGNDTFGIGVTDVCSAFEIPPSRCDKLGFDPLANYTRTEQNIALQNRVDLLWTANGVGNCWLKNRATIRVPKSLPRCAT
jgi:nitrous oxidase accessory protein NosD